MTHPHLEELWRKIDAFFERVRGRYPSALACRAGCDDCCKRRLSVTGVEADAIVEGLAAMGEAGERLAERARGSDGSVCAALGPDGRCGIYAVRPLVCRSHGLPIRFTPERAVGGRRGLPVIDACEKNFQTHSLPSLDADCVLDQETLSVLLAAVDAANADALGRPRGVRFELAELVGAGKP